MKRLEDLREIADETLGGLNASQGLKYRIQTEAAKGAPQKRRLPVTAIATACCALALVVGIAGSGVLNNSPVSKGAESTPVAEVMKGRAVTSDEAGTADMEMSDMVAMAMPAENETMIVNMPAGAAEEACEAAEPLEYAIAMSSRSFSVTERNAPDYESLWEESNGSAFPLIRLDGRYYRLMKEPAELSGSLLSGKLGTVTEYTLEPSLSQTNAVMSNVVLPDTEIWAVDGMDNTLVAAEVDGRMRLFQRVSFSNNARRGSEGFADTLQISGRVTGMALSGVGTVTGSECERLFGILCKNGEFKSSGMLTNRQTLLIQLDNGLVVQLIVKGDSVSACGVWSCPDFFDAFNKACQ